VTKVSFGEAPPKEYSEATVACFFLIGDAMRIYPELFSTVSLFLSVFSSARASETMTLPHSVNFSSKSRDALIQLWALSDNALDDLFLAAETPKLLPKGLYSGFHRIAVNSTADVPGPLLFASFELWQTKDFGDGELRDRVRALPFSTRAQLRLAPMRNILAEKPWPVSSNATLDNKVSLITDYEAVTYSFPLSPFANAARGWVDEFRELTVANQVLFLGRSTYRGQFWCYVALVSVEQDTTNR
jgi:hypothetical protein